MVRPQVAADQASERTLRRRRAFLRSLSDKLLGKAKIRAKQKIRRTRAKPSDCKTRQRDPKNPSPSTVMDALFAKRSSYNTWMRFVASNERNKRSKGVYRSRVTTLKDSLVGNVGGVLLNPKGASLQTWKAVGTWLYLLDRDRMYHSNVKRKSVNVFIDSNDMPPYSAKTKKKKCTLLALTAPEIYRPHEVDTILRVARWLDYEDCNTLRDCLDDVSMVEVLQAVQNGTLTADKRDITWAPDWGAYEMVLGWVDPGHEEGCLECYARRGQWHIPGLEKQPMRLLQHCRTACKRVLQLFPDRRNIVYDPLHCIALVLTMILLHGLDLLFQDKHPNHVEELRRIYRQHIQGGEYRGPAQAGPEYKGWKLSNNQAKALLDTEEFWVALAGLFGRACAHVVDDLVFYVNELRRLADQLLSWNPSRVSTRNADCDRLHALYIQLGLPKERITAQVHYFLCHYQSRLDWHGN